MNRPRIFLSISKIEEESAERMIRGVLQNQKLRRTWDFYWDEANRLAAEPEMLGRGKWDGVISRHTTAAIVDVCKRLKIPLVDLNDCPPFPRIPKVRPDNPKVGRLGAEHLLSRGFHHFAFVGFHNAEWSTQRLDGFSARLREAGRQPVIFESLFEPACSPEWTSSETAALMEWLRTLRHPLGIMACNDLRAIQIEDACRKLRLRVPEDVAVLGVNDNEIRCELAHPALSSINIGQHQMGMRAAQILQELLAGDMVPAPETLLDPLGIIMRQSTDILAIQHPKLTGALKYIHAHACKGITVSAVSNHTGIARTQLETVFRKLLGRSPGAEIRQVQLAKIRELLLGTDLTVKAISEKTGFRHAEYLNVFFKRATGETPGQYRERMREIA